MYLVIPEGLSLYPFQLETVSRTLQILSTSPAKGAYVANEQGLGKTITALVTANTLASRHTLIVCPAIMRLVWEAEVYKWCRFSSQSIPRVLVIESGKDLDQENLNNYQFVICSYALAASKHVLAEFMKYYWDLLISDENHFCKNLAAKRTKALFHIARHATYKLLMSGTPMSANVVDLFAPCHMLAPELPLFQSFNAFAARYSNYTEMSVPVRRNGHTQSILVKKYYGLKNAKELSDTIRALFYIRYKKEQVLPQLPPKIFQKIILPESYSVRVQEKNREKIIREKQLVFEYLEKGLLPVPCDSFAEHRRVQGENKVPAIVEFVQPLLDEGIPLVLFAHHRNVISKLCESLKKYNPVAITGETKDVDRMASCDAFERGRTNLFVGNLVAAGVGITLVRGSTVCLCELDWVPNTLLQAIDRVHRIGQKSQVLVYWFLVKNSMDEQLDELVIRRTKEAAEVLEEK